MITYTIDRFPDGWTAHRWDNSKVLSLIGTGRGPIAALTDLIEKEKTRGQQIQVPDREADS